MLVCGRCRRSSVTRYARGGNMAHTWSNVRAERGRPPTLLLAFGGKRGTRSAAEAKNKEQRCGGDGRGPRDVFRPPRRRAGVLSPPPTCIQSPGGAFQPIGHNYVMRQKYLRPCARRGSLPLRRRLQIPHSAVPTTRWRHGPACRPCVPLSDGSNVSHFSKSLRLRLYVM